VSTTHPGGPPSGRPEREENPTNTWDMSPPGGVPARRSERESPEHFERGRAYVRPATDLGEGGGSLRWGSAECKAGGRGAAGAIAVGSVGSAGLVWVTASCGLPLAAIVTMGSMPLVLAVILILVGLLRK
jgi:hypothetical protein